MTKSPWKPLARELTVEERRLLDHLVAFADVPELTAQAATARVSAICSCGCASIQLDCDGPDIPAATLGRLSPRGRDDHVGIGCDWYDDKQGDVDDDEPCQVVLHVGSRLIELELFRQEGERLSVPDPSDLPTLEFT